MTREELEAAIESEEGAVPHVHGPGCGHDHSHDAKPVTEKDIEPAAADAPAEAEAPKKKAATRKAPAKKAEAAPAEVAEGEAAPAPAKKPRAKKKVETEASEG